MLAAVHAEPFHTSSFDAVLKYTAPVISVAVIVERWIAGFAPRVSVIAKLSRDNAAAAAAATASSLASEINVRFTAQLAQDGILLRLILIVFAARQRQDQCECRRGFIDDLERAGRLGDAEGESAVPRRGSVEIAEPPAMLETSIPVKTLSFL